MIMKESGVDFINIYRQLLCPQIPKAQKIQSSHQSFLPFWDLWASKQCENVGEIDP
jgi:hypothetical protein